MSEADPKDPRFRPYRAVALGVYLTFTIGFSALIIFSVYRSVLKMTPDRPPASVERLNETECLARARGLFIELEQERKSLGDQTPVADSDQRFLEFRVRWLKEKRDIESRCDLESQARARAAFASLDRVLDLYTTASVQFSGAVGPSVDDLKRELNAP